MDWRDIKSGTVVYHPIYVTWGRGVVQAVVPPTALERAFERGSKRAVVQFAHGPQEARLLASELRKRPAKRRMAEMAALYRSRGVEVLVHEDHLEIVGEQVELTKDTISLKGLE